LGIIYSQFCLDFQIPSEMARLKLRELEQYLGELEGFQEPKVKLEQYETRPHIAACMLHTIEASFGDLDGKLVADLGCGTGRLSIGAALLGAQLVVGFDVDADALNVCKENIAEMELDNIDTILCDVREITLRDKQAPFDTVIMNPPFGTSSKGIDMEFLRVALSLTRGPVYSLNKSTTRKHVLKKAQQYGVKAQVIAQLRFDLPATYKFHKKDSVDIEVDFIRFCNN